MDRSVLHRRIFFAGGIWNLAMGVPIFLLVPWLPSLLKISEPLYPIFIYFNLMTVTMFGLVTLVVSRHVNEMRPIIAILVWSKILTFAVFVGAYMWTSMPRELTEFLVGGMVVDLALGFIYWRVWMEIKPK